jgi:monomeric sarcosine oxidase
MAAFDVIVLGIGGVGSAALYYAARAGARTIGLDRFIAPHNRGSSHGQTRIIRQAYFEHSDYVPLLLESYRLWNELEQRVDKQLFLETGLLQVGPEDGVVVPGVLRSAQEHSLNVESLSAKEVETRWPHLRVPSGLVGVLEPKAGYLLVEECVSSFLWAAREAGAEVAAPCEVVSWEPGAPIRLNTTSGTLATNKLIITAGAWAGSLLDDLNLRLRVLRKAILWFNARSGTGNLPCYLYELTNTVMYGFPAIDGRIKVAEHSGGTELVDPLRYDRNLDPHDAENALKFLQKCLPDATDGLAEHQTCLYTMSSDENFIIDCHPEHANVLFAAGLSGHGFKFTPVLGKALADRALTGETGMSLDFLRLNRSLDRP